MSRLVVLLTTIIAATTIAAPAARAADTTIGFDDQPVGTMIYDQYPGVLIGEPSSFPGTSTFCGAPNPITASAAAHSGGQVLWTGDCSTQPRSARSNGQFGGFLFTFTTFRQHVSVWTGSPGDPDCMRIPHGVCHLATLTAFDIDGNVLGQASVPNRPILQQLAVTASSNAIAYATISSDVQGAAPNAIDDLSFDNPATPPAPTFRIGTEQTSLHVTQGGQASTTVDIIRFNGSTGPVGLSATGMPQGVKAWSFDPNPADGRAAMFELATDPTVPVGSYPITVTGTPQSGLAGSAPSSATAVLSVKAPYQLTGVLPATLSSCDSTRETLHVSADPSFHDPITLAWEVPDGVTVAPSTTTITPGFDTTVTVDLSAKGVPASGQIKFGIQGGGATQVIASAPLTGEAPWARVEQNAGGYEILGYGAGENSPIAVDGNGWCPGSKLRVSNDLSIVPVSPSTDPTTGAKDFVDVPLPRYATTGNVSIIEPDGTSVPAGSITVKTFRNTAGFPFKNLSEPLNPTVDDMFWLFGDQARLRIDPCKMLTLGLGSCDVASGSSLTPTAAVYLQALQADQSKGWCFGFASLELQMWNHEALARQYGSTTGNAFNVPNVNGPAGDLRLALHRAHFAQFAQQVIDARGNHPRDRADAVAQIDDALNKVTPPLIGFRQGGKGHAVAAYGIEYLVNGDIAIDVLDSNVPYTAGEDVPAQAGTHQALMDGSRIYLHPDNSWDFGGGLNWHGNINSSLYVLPFDRIPGAGQGVLPYRNATDFIFGDGGSATGPDGKPLPADPAAESDLQTAVAPGGTAVTVTPGAGGVVGAFSGTFAALVTSAGGVRAASAGPSAPVKIDARAGVVDASAAGSPVTITDVVGAGSGAQREAVVTAPGGARVAMGSGGTLDLTARRPGTLAVTLSSTAHGVPTAATLRVRVGARRKLRIAPSHWGDLTHGTIGVDGRQVHARSNGSGRIAVKAATVTGGTAASRVLQVDVRVARPVPAAGGVVTVVLERGTHVVTVGSSPLDSRALAGGGTIAVRLQAPAGRYTAITTAVLAAPGHGATRAVRRGRVVLR